MGHTSKNVETKPTLKRADLEIIQFALYQTLVDEEDDKRYKELRNAIKKVNEMITLNGTKCTIMYEEDDKWCLGVCKDYKFDEDATQIEDDQWLKYYLFDTKKEAEIEAIILGVEQDDLTIEDIAKVLDINDRKSLCIGGLNYYYGDGGIGAYYPKSDEVCMAWTDAKGFRIDHEIFITADLREYMR